MVVVVYFPLFSERFVHVKYFLFVSSPLSGFVPVENVVPYAGNKQRYGSSGMRVRGFTEGMWEIENKPGHGSKPRVRKSVSLSHNFHGFYAFHICIINEVLRCVSLSLHRCLP